MYRKNVGRLDRLARLVVAAVVLPVGLFPLGGLHGEPLGIVTAVIGVAALTTALTARCPGYVPFGIDTRRGRRETGSGRVATEPDCPQQLAPVARPLTASVGAREDDSCGCQVA